MKNELTKYDTVIIGGGLSGIAAALRRKKRGDSVLLLEKNPYLGGKLDVLEWEDYRWDKGPSLFTMPHLVDELFELFDRRSEDYFQYIRHDESCRYYYPDGTAITLYSHPEKRKAHLKKVLSSIDAERTEAYIKETEKLYNAIGELFIAKPKLSLKDFFKLEVVRQYPKLLSRQMLSSLNTFNERKLKNDKLVQLFNRFGTYNGSNPYEMSGLYSMIPHLELNLGTYFPKGGMRSIIDSLERLSLVSGIEIRKNEDNLRAIPEKNGFIVKSNQSEIRAKNLVCSIDHLNFYQNVLRDHQLTKKYQKEQRSTSALVFYWAIKGKHKQIGLHNIYFSSDYRREFDSLFNQKKLAADPTVYIHNSSVVEKNDAPDTGENWFVMINTPAGVEPDEEYLKNARDHIRMKVKAVHGIDLKDNILFEERWTMKNIEKITGSVEGALYGGAFNSKTASFKRHGNKSKKYKNLYFTGGSVHPGGGIPLVLKSAKIVDELIERTNEESN